MIQALISAVRFWWKASAGDRLRPWRSPYLRWRLETYTGKPAATLVAWDFFQLAWAERQQMPHFFRWVRQMERISHGEKP
jgi:hypothetical protein